MNLKNLKSNGPQRGTASSRNFGIAAAIAFILLFDTGCSTTEYHRQADEENYEIIRKVEEQVFGKTNAFTINTRHSSLKLDEVQIPEVIKERMVNGELPLTLASSLDIAVRQSREFQREKENLYLAALSLSDRRNVFASIWSGSANTSIERETDADGRATGGGQLGLSKRIFRTGGTISGLLVNDMFKYFVGNPSRQVVNTISLNLTQPLLRGGGRHNSVANSLTQAERDVIYAIRDYSQFQKRFAVDVVNAYLDLLGRKNTVRNNYANYLSQQKAALRAETRVPRDGKLNENLARQSELRAKNSYINSITDYQNALDRFKDRLAIPLSMDVMLDDGPFNQLQTTGLSPISFDAESAYNLSVEKHLPTLNEVDRFEDAKRRVLVAANSLKPGLNIVGGASLATPAPDDYTNFDPDRVRANMGVELDLPFNRVTERNAYRSSLINFERQIRSLGQTLDTRRAVIAQGLRTLLQREATYRNNVVGVEIAETRVAQQNMLIEAGRANQQTLIDAENDLIGQRNARVSAIVSFQQARLQLLLDAGVINTDSPDFWIQPQYAPTPAAAPDTAPSATPTDVLTPEQLFKETAP
jgi:outer membrane protein TolC